jgi:adenylyltransferase/sulfurtransferase
MQPLNPRDYQRYARHIVLPEVGVTGQERLRASRVLVVGAGGLGSPVLLYLVAAGVGTIGVVDADVVDVSNLQRQIIHTTATIGVAKVVSAAQQMHALDPACTVVTHAMRVTAANALELVRQYDIVIDATDSFATRYVLNDACVIAQKPLVYGAIFRFEGQASLFAPHLGGPCYRCLFPDPPPPELAPNCAEAGVFGVLPGVVGAVQATEAIKYILGIGTTLQGWLWLYDALTMQVDRWQVARNPQCARCGDTPTIQGMIDMDAVCAMPAHSEKSVHEVAAWLQSATPPLLVDVREEHEYALSHLPGAQRIGVNAIGTLTATERPVVVYCRSGMRSGRACGVLRTHGIEAWSMTGGLLAWQQHIDAEMPVA